jgi:hypothetical protein
MAIRKFGTRAAPGFTAGTGGELLRIDLRAQAAAAAVAVADGEYAVVIDRAELLPTSKRGATSIRLEPVTADGTRIRLRPLCVGLANGNGAWFVQRNSALLCQIADIGVREFNVPKDAPNLAGVELYIAVRETADEDGHAVNELLEVYPLDPDADPTAAEKVDPEGAGA